MSSKHKTSKSDLKKVTGGAGAGISSSLGAADVIKIKNPTPAPKPGLQPAPQKGLSKGGGNSSSSNLV